MLDDTFQKISDLGGGIPIDQVRFISSILLTYPIAYFFRYLPNSPTLKHFANIFITTFLFLGIHGQTAGFFHLLFSCFITYSTLLFAKPDNAPKLIFIWAMGHMSYTHIYRQIFDYGQATLDYSGPQMIWTIKLTMLAWNVRDGSKKDEELSDYQKERKIVKIPSILEFLGYIFFFCGFAAGPGFDFAEYTRFIEQKGELSSKKIPSPAIPCLKAFTASMFYLILTQTVSQIFTLTYCLRPEFAALSFFNKFAFVLLSAAMERNRYYFVWLMAEGSSILSGFGYNGLDEKGNHKWDRMTNVRPIEIETSQSLKGILDNWNIGTNQWLKHYVYLRIAPIGSKNTAFASLCAFATSAFWHGFYPGYYLTFLLMGFVSETSKNLRRSLRPIVIYYGKSNPSIIRFYNIAGWALSQISLSYFIIPFIILEFGSSMNVWRQLFYFGHIALFIAWAFFKFGGVQFFKKFQPKEQIENGDLKKKSN